METSRAVRKQAQGVKAPSVFWTMILSMCRATSDLKMET